MPSVAPLEPARAPDRPKKRHLDVENDADAGAIAAGEWLAAHGMTAGDLVDRLYGCEVVTVGKPARDGLFCAMGAPMKGSVPTGESLFPVTVWAADGKKLRVAFEAPIAAGALDCDSVEPGVAGGGCKYVQLEAELTADGTTIAVRESAVPAEGCAHALAEYKGANLARHRSVIQTACRSIGSYVWRGDRFVRAPTPAPHATSAP